MIAWRMMLAGAFGGALSIATSWLFTAFLFHRYQQLTPTTWRAEGWQQHALASALAVAGGAAFGLLYAATGGLLLYVSPHWWLQGAAFGALVWATIALPALLVTYVYVNLHRGVLVGLALDGLCAMLILGACCARAAG